MANEKPGYDPMEEIGVPSGGHHDTMQSILIKAPSWFGSAVIHGVVFLIMLQVQWDVTSKNEKNVVAKLTDEPPEVVEEVPEPEQPELEDVMLEDDAPSTEVEMEEMEMDQQLVDVPGFNEMEPDEAPPLQIAKLALGEDGAPGHFLGIYRSRGGSGKRKGLMRGGGSRGSEKAVIDSLGWLARVQEPDGHWDSVKWGAGGNVDNAVTGLALLAFLGHGETDREGKYRQTVYKALEWMEKSNNNGFFAGTYYTQGICTMAVSEAYGLTRNERWGAMAQKAVDHLINNMNPKGGWDYNGNNPERVDTSVTGWCVMAVKSAHASGLKAPEQAIERIKQWLRESINADGTTGYQRNPNVQGTGGGTPAMTAVATLGRQFMGWPRDSEDMQKGLNYLARSGPNLQNEYYYYYGTLCMFQAGGPIWDDWNKKLRDPLIALQVKGRGPEFDGSWDPTGTYGTHGGRVYQTAMAVFTLEVYYRFLPVLK
ncbi:MAG TPA: prenyltransferase/squalene oxidase repeat-containing protein [Planctomycetota bacterium]|nr:prenyltransferase/squalene oxidase repeat-containing protein [Planctomycetota bacterium]